MTNARRRGVRTLLLLSALAALPAHAGPAETRLPNDLEMAELHRVVSELRGLQFSEPVPRKSIPLGAFAARLRAQAAFAEEATAARQRAFETLGVYAPETDEAEARFRMAVAAGTAFYARAPLRTMYVVDRGPVPERNLRRMMIDMLLSLLGSRWELVLTAHELTHALQDQWFPGSLAPRGNDDEVLARTALFEGDANLVTYEYLAHLAKRTAEDLFASQGDLPFDAGAWMGLPEVDTAPRYLRESFQMPYTSGVAFVRAIRARGGWEAVNRAHADPPRSTEQVLHPEKYLGERDPPEEVRLPPLGEVFPGRTVVRENTLGEFGMRVMFHEIEGEFIEFIHGAVCAGWGGDRYAVLESPASGERTLVFASVWDTDGDAALFFDRYRVASGRKVGQPWDWGTKEGDVRFVGRTPLGRLVLMRRDGPRVLVLEGVPADGEALVDRVWRAMPGWPPVSGAPR